MCQDIKLKIRKFPVRFKRYSFLSKYSYCVRQSLASLRALINLDSSGKDPYAWEMASFAMLSVLMQELDVASELEEHDARKLVNFIRTNQWLVFDVPFERWIPQTMIAQQYQFQMRPQILAERYHYFFTYRHPEPEEDGTVFDVDEIIYKKVKVHGESLLDFFFLVLLSAVSNKPFDEMIPPIAAALKDGVRHVYSLAKTLWILITNDNKCFDGRYEWNDPKIGLHFRPGLERSHLSEIEDLLRRATSNEPEERPTMAVIVEELKQWQESSEDEVKAQISEWEFLKKYIFGQYTPSSAVFTDINDIVSILGIVCGMPAYNHTLLSVKGGGDLRRVMLYNEPETVLLDLDGWMIVLKPKELRIELFANSAWNYLVLTADHLPAIEGIPCAKNVQELVCDFPQHYVDAKDAVYGVYDYDSGRRLPTDALRLERWMSGSLLIVPKEGPYNRIQSVYDGRHDELSHEDFRNYINQLCLWAGGGDKWRTSDLNRIDDILSSEKQHRVVEHLRHSVCGISPSEYIKGNWQKFGVSLFDDCRRRQCSCMQYRIALQPTEISFGRAGFAEADKYVLSCDGKLLPDGCEKNKIMYVDDHYHPMFDFC